jgi:predicted esterase
MIGRVHPRRVRRARVTALVSLSIALLVVIAPSANAFLLDTTPTAITAAVGVRYIDPVFSSVTVTGGIIYGQAPNSRQQTQQLILDLYQPAGDAAPARGAMVFAHGGAFHGGSRSEGKIVRYATEYAKRGWVVASIDYRVRPGASGVQLAVESYTTGSPTIRDAQHDMQAAVRWLRSNAGALRIDQRRIVTGGSSAGAIVALATNFRSDDPGSSGNPGFSSAVAAAVSIMGAEVPQAIGLLESPIVMFHGTNDTTVPFPLAAVTCATTLALANICDFHPYAGAGHNLGSHFNEIIKISSDFLYKNVIQGPKRGRLPA